MDSVDIDQSVLRIISYAVFHLTTDCPNYWEIISEQKNLIILGARASTLHLLCSAISFVSSIVEFSLGTRLPSHGKR